MSVEAHLTQLNSKHAELETAIDREMRSPAPDQIRLSKLKREKLQIKDRISQLAD